MNILYYQISCNSVRILQIIQNEFLNPVTAKPLLRKRKSEVIHPVAITKWISELILVEVNGQVDYTLYLRSLF